MQIKQFEDKNLAHYSYAIMSDYEKKMVLVDPSRNPQQYMDFAKEMDAEITGIIETHPHADFVSSHLEFHETMGAVIYASSRTDAAYPHKTFNKGQHIQLGEIKLYALDTPGHSPDSICILLEHDGRQKVVFTGDTLFIGDCGRPDLRPDNGDANKEAEKLAKQMYHSLRDKLIPLHSDTIVYPAHGAGTLCGKALGKANSSTIGEEKKTNWALQEQPEKEFIMKLLRDQPFIPAYFPFDVQLNKKGASGFIQSIDAIKIREEITNQSAADGLDKRIWILDVRNEHEFKKGHLRHSINLMKDAKFETWLGCIIKPGERFYIAATDEKSINEAIERTAAIGYESQVEEAFVLHYNEVLQEDIDVNEFSKRTNDYTIIDVRNTSEVKEKIFKNGILIPLSELRESIH